jgi:hypothetical protein
MVRVPMSDSQWCELLEQAGVVPRARRAPRVRLVEEQVVPMSVYLRPFSVGPPFDSGGGPLFHRAHGLAAGLVLGGVRLSVVWREVGGAGERVGLVFVWEALSRCGREA